ncbi:MAG TPA: sugar phosphate isomerase/epimerase family protein [Ktedonobacteraceae bacterium]|nr:sugar phosphate isomerase/epimerase family protein [Ktedonobacteraceae bacterium]
MRLLCSTGTFSRSPDYTTYQQVLRYAPFFVTDKGVEGFELLFYSSWYPHLDRIAHDLEQSGLKFPVMHAEKNIGTSLGKPQPEQRQQAVVWLVENCRLGQLLGAKLLVLHLWGWPELDDNLENNLQLLSTCLDIASEHGIALAIETVPARHAKPLSNIQRALRQDERCYVALDTEFLALTEQLDEVFELEELWQRKRVCHVHIKDFDGQTFLPNRERRYLHPGEGSIDFKRFFARLKKRGFDGFVSLEASALNREGRVDIEKLHESLRFVREMMNMP